MSQKLLFCRKINILVPEQVFKKKREYFSSLKTSLSAFKKTFHFYILFYLLGRKKIKIIIEKHYFSEFYMFLCCGIMAH